MKTSAIHTGGTHRPRTFRPTPPAEASRLLFRYFIDSSKKNLEPRLNFHEQNRPQRYCILSNIPRPRRAPTPPPPSIYARRVIGILTGNTPNGRRDFKRQSINERRSLSFSQREGRKHQGPSIWAGSRQQPHSALATRGAEGTRTGNGTDGPVHLIGASDRLAGCHAG